MQAKQFVTQIGAGLVVTVPAGSTSTSVTFTVPRLIDDSVVATGCCATLVEDIITEELTAWAGVEAVVIEQTIGYVIVFYDPARLGPDTIRETLEAIDYPAVQMGQHPVGSGSARCAGPQTGETMPGQRESYSKGDVG